MKRLIFLFSLLASALHAQDLSLAANNFLQSLDAGQRASANFRLEDGERYNWHFIPRARKGACFKTFTQAQKDAAVILMKACLSDQGYQKATSIMALENVLREMEDLPVNDLRRDPVNYYISIFGTPSKTGPWGWRLEGHHVSINFSASDNLLVSSTPSFFGTNPAIVPRGPEKGKQILKAETDMGYDLVNSLTAEQKKKAIFSEKAPADILTFNQPKAKQLEPAGLSYKDMLPVQQQAFLKLLTLYVQNYQLGFSNKLMDKIRAAGIENLSFAWAGGLSPGTGNYYRIQGPMLLIEYDNTQTNANHVHSVVRDLTNDFAEDILREHYRLEH